MKQVKRWFSELEQSYQIPILLMVSLCLVVLSIVMVRPYNIEAKEVDASRKETRTEYVVGDYFGTLARIFVGDGLGLCVEGWMPFYQGKYEEHAMSKSDLNADQIQRIKLLNFYGNKLNMKEDDLIYGTVQFMVWETIRDVTVKQLSWGFTVEQYNNQKQIMNNLVAKHTVKPSFSQQNITLEIGETVTYTDTNKMFEFYHLVSSDNGILSVSQTGNTLQLTAKKEGNVTLTWENASAHEVGDSWYYKRASSQSFGVFKLDKAESFSMSVKAVSPFGNLELTKVDRDGKQIAGVVFDINGTRHTTDEAGLIQIKGMKPGSISIKEVFVPEPMLLDETIHYASIHPGETTHVNITNDRAQGAFTITKKTEYGEPVAGAVFEVRAQQQVLARVSTNIDGVVKTPLLPLGHYEIVEVYVPDTLILDDTPRNASLVYKDAYTALVESQVDFVNQYKPILDLGIKMIRIDTQVASLGLDVEAWFDVAYNYDWAVNDFGDALIHAEIVRLSDDTIMSTKTFSAKTIPAYSVFPIVPSLLQSDEHHHYELRLSVDEANKVNLKNSRLDTVGYTASQLLFEVEVEEDIWLEEKGVIRTQRSYGQAMEEYWEQFSIWIPKMGDLIAGRGFRYDVQAKYLNDLDQQYNHDVTLALESGLVDGQWYPVEDGLVMVKLEQDGQHYNLPQVYAKKTVAGEVMSHQAYQNLSPGDKKLYRSGGQQILSPLWSPLKHYSLMAQTTKVGVHQNVYHFNDTIELYAYLYGWEHPHGSSPSIKLDQVLVSPVYSMDRNGNGMVDAWEKGNIPDNWGLKLVSGSRKLKDGERDFLRLNTR